MILGPTTSCWNWACERSSLPGQHTCTEHVTEEPEIERQLSELGQLRNHIGEWEHAAASDRPHPDAAKGYIEGPVRTYLQHALPSSAVRPGFSGDLKRQIDVTITSSTLVDDWTADVYTVVNSRDLEAHLEISYRGGTSWSDLRRKLLDDLGKLHRTIDHAIAENTVKPWVGLVLLGPGWSIHHVKVCGLLHDFYHGRPPQPVGSGSEQWWPVIDGVALPRLFLKKQVVNSERDAQSPKACMWSIHPTSFQDPAREFRPLAILVAFLRHYIRHRFSADYESFSVLPNNEWGAALGPRPTESDFIRLQSGALAALLSVHDNYGVRVFRAVGRTWVGLEWDQGVMCANGKPFLAYPIPDDFDLSAAKEYLSS